jgi:DNA-binding response OmpR family regulator
MDSPTQILVIDDDPLVRGLLEYQLRRAGYEPAMAEDGAHGLAMLQEEPERFASVLLDRTLPGLNGMEVLFRLKADDALRALPVIMVTGIADPESVREGLEAGAYYYLTKPFDSPMLLAIVRTAVNDRREHRTLRDRARRTVGTFSLMVRGDYRLRTLEEARDLAGLLAQCSADPERIVVGLSELLINAVEHGNLGITYEEKSALIDAGGWEAEVARRLQLPGNRDKRAKVAFERTEGEIRYRIEDCGDGFDWRRYLEISPARAFHTHGRGIAMSRNLSFDRLEYFGAGNQVVAIRGEPTAPSAA